jgi:hypothetical protein
MYPSTSNGQLGSGFERIAKRPTERGKRRVRSRLTALERRLDITHPQLALRRHAPSDRRLATHHLPRLGHGAIFRYHVEFASTAIKFIDD